MEKQNTSPEKLTDKAFSRFLFASVLGILVCITCLCSATWAWFSANISSDNNVLGTGNFGLTVTVTDEDGNAIDVSKSVSGTTSVTLGDAGLYTVTLKMTDDTTVTRGFCNITSKGARYQTDSIITDETDPFVFTIDAKEDGMTLALSPAWGIPAEPEVGYHGTLPLSTPSAPSAEN